MPGRDGTGPMGDGSMTGRGLGFCTAAGSVKYGSGLGLGRRRGAGRFFAANSNFSGTQKELLQEQKNILQNRLEVVEKQLERL